MIWVLDTCFIKRNIVPVVRYSVHRKEYRMCEELSVFLLIRSGQDKSAYIRSFRSSLSRIGGCAKNVSDALSSSIYV